MEENLGAMLLSGYVRLVEHGFALPVYRSGPDANAWYAAVPLIEGDHTTIVTGFEPLGDEEIVPLVDAPVTVQQGDAWQDVFLWAGQVHVGTALEIFQALAASEDDLKDQAALSYLDLALAAGASSSPQIAAAARSFLDKRLGGVLGAAAFQDLVVRPGVLLELGRLHGRAAHGRKFPDFLRDFVVREYEPGRFDVAFAPGTLRGLGEGLAADEFRGSIARLADAIGFPLRASGLEEPDAGKHSSEIETGVYTRVADGDAEASPSVLIVAADRRAAQIARYLEPPVGLLFGVDPARSASHYRIQREGERTDDEGRGVIQVVRRLGRSRKLDSFAVVVWLAGNDALTSDASHEFEAFARSASDDIVFLLAPAPPAYGPSVFFSEGDDGSARRSFDAIVDTTLARSPFWGGQARRSVDRRMADIVMAASVGLALDGRFRAAVRKHRGHKSPSVLSFVGGHAEFSGGRATASELSNDELDQREGSPGPDVRLELETPDWVGKRRRDAFVVLHQLRQDFDRFARAAVVEALRPEVVPIDAGGDRDKVSMRVREVLEYPELACAVRIPGRRDRPGLVVTAETPDLRALREGERARSSVVRYTDVETIRALAGGTSARRELPSEIRLPQLRRYPGSRGLVTRGVDTRDVVRLPANEWEALAKRHRSSELVGEVRRYRAAIDVQTNEIEVALPAPSVSKAASDGDALARILLERARGIARTPGLSGKRIGDLNTAWSRPARSARRWVVEDGRIPVELALLKRDEVPAQRLFQIDGDSAVPAFLVSRLFHVWARALLPSSTSWASRFQVSKTFDAFPFPRSFAVAPGRNGSPPRLYFNRDGGRLAGIADALAQDISEDMIYEHAGNRSLRSHPATEDLDALMLEEYELPLDATDLDILERLVDANRRQA